ncbi:hypothetical protein RFI_02121 [Reticulomyxa filosa]|uniref:Kelch motif family protein n=1 Tax=Reticulomyxa filosa TaxID=46433 RepID=X6PA02_RETFI|nr:hypothetical protein RFI_02121 [Reticulomyxa filosa]|eukprot:ETO34953.1 hypothetical protein RFI_02121 [Reticulomyxa filosa]
MSDELFQTLKDFPTPLDESQCVFYNKHELLICGGYEQKACYSYNILKNEYKFICDYPSDLYLVGHCVVKVVDNNNNNNNKDDNEIILLSFGGSKFRKRHTLIMKYVSVWSNISNKLNKLNNFNQWIPFTDHHNHPIIIGRDENHNYHGARAVISGSNNHLLFITYQLKNISIFDLNTFQFIKHCDLPTNEVISYHCFISKLENGQKQEMIKKNKQTYQMILFSRYTGLSIEYNENNNTFQFHQLSVYNDIALLRYYAYVYINDLILFFGGWNGQFDDIIISKSIYKYLIEENKWMTFQSTLPNPLCDCIAILNEEDNFIHIIGGRDDKNITLSTHMKTKVRVLDPSQLSKNEMKFINQYWIRILDLKLGWIDDFYNIIFKYIKMK